MAIPVQDHTKEFPRDTTVAFSHDQRIAPIGFVLNVNLRASILGVLGVKLIVPPSPTQVMASPLLLSVPLHLRAASVLEAE